MTVANPIFLWALTGLTIPFAIHLLSRKEGKILKLGSLRHVQETSTQQFRGIRLNEVALLLLRCTLITLFTFILAGLLFDRARDTKWVVVEKGLDRQARIRTMIDSLATEGYQPRLLARGFPELRDSTGSQQVNYRELASSLARKNISSIIVFATNRPESFAGVSATLDDKIVWISQPAGNVNYSLQSFRVAKDSIVERKGHSDAEVTTFQYSAGQPGSTEAIPQRKIIVGFVVDQGYEPEARIMKAALRALDGMLPAKITIEEDPGKVAALDWRVWLSNNDPPSERIIRLKPGGETNLVVRTGPSEWILTKRLSEDLAIQSNLSLALAEIIFPGKNELQAIASAHDKRMLPDSLVWSFNGSDVDRGTQAGVASESSEPFLLVTFLLVLVSERVLAYHRQQ